jgi:hypothetical protein
MDLREITRLEMEEIISKGNFDLLDEVYTEKYVSHDPTHPEPIRGRDEARALVESIRSRPRGPVGAGRRPGGSRRQGSHPLDLGRTPHRRAVRHPGKTAIGDIWSLSPVSRTRKRYRGTEER